jgi:hypothetical protein
MTVVRPDGVIRLSEDQTLAPKRIDSAIQQLADLLRKDCHPTFALTLPPQRATFARGITCPLPTRSGPPAVASADAPGNTAESSVRPKRGARSQNHGDKMMAPGVGMILSS